MQQLILGIGNAILWVIEPYLCTAECKCGDPNIVLTNISTLS